MRHIGVLILIYFIDVMQFYYLKIFFKMFRDSFKLNYLTILENHFDVKQNLKTF